MRNKTLAISRQHLFYTNVLLRKCLATIEILSKNFFIFYKVPVNINILRSEAHRACFNCIRHVGLIEHAYRRNLQINYSSHPFLQFTINSSDRTLHVNLMSLTFELNAIPTPQMPLSATAAISPAQRVPWLLNPFDVHRGYG